MILATIILVLTFLSNNSLSIVSNPANIIFYIIFGGFICLGIYLVVKTARFKVVVKSEKITVCPMIGRRYAFTFNEIASVLRQVKRNRLKSERMVVKTIAGKKFVVESIEISYERFLRRIETEVNGKFREGF